MARYILDSSVVLEWITPSSQQIRNAVRIRELLVSGSVQVVAPEFLLLETSNVLYWKKSFAEDEVKSFIDWLIVSPISLAKISREEIKEIIRIMYKYGTTSYDSLYLFLAHREKCKLLTLDQKLLKIKKLTMGLDQIKL